MKKKKLYSPIRSLEAEQESFYGKLVWIIEQLELTYLEKEPDLIIVGDFNLPLEPNMNNRR
jgi:hypothetical protein